MVPSVLIAAALAALLGGAPDERDLAARIRDGDADAFRHFFDTTHARLLRSLARSGLDAAAADDVAQQAYVWIWEHRAEIDLDRPLGGLLFRIGVTRGLNARRDARRTEALPDAEPEAGDTGDPAALADVRAALAAAVESLPERRRETFTLCFTDGLSHREAAEALGVSPRTVEHQMALALGAIRERLAPFLSDSGASGKISPADRESPPPSV